MILWKVHIHKRMDCSKKKNPLVENLSLYEGRIYHSTFRNWYEFMNQMMAESLMGVLKAPFYIVAY